MSLAFACSTNNGWYGLSDVPETICFAQLCQHFVLTPTAHLPPSCRSYIIPVYHQTAGQQPYPRSTQSKAMSISLGSGGNKVSYNFTVDTGSGVLLATCRSPTSIANCGGSLPADKNYALTAATTVTDAATCSSTGIGCMLSPTNTCFISEQVSWGTIHSHVAGREGQTRSGHCNKGCCRLA